MRVIARVSTLLAFALWPSVGYSQTDSSVESNPKVQQRLQEIKAMKEDLLRKMQDFDNRIHTLEAQVKRQKSETEKIAAKAVATPQQPLPPWNTVTAAKYDALPDKMKPILAASTAPQETSLKATENPPANPPISTAAPAIKVFGAAKLDIFYNSARPQAPGIPFFVVPRFAGGFSQETIDINARQSQLGVTFTGPMIGNFQSGGKVSAVFFDNTILADRNGFLLQQAYGELFNDALEVRRRSATGCLRSGLADGSALFRLRWLGQRR